MAAFLDLLTGGSGVIGLPFALRGNTTPVVGENTLASSTVPANNLLQLSQVEISSLHPGRAEILVDAVVVARFRLDAGKITHQHFFLPEEKAIAAQVVTIKYFALPKITPSDVSWDLTGILIAT